MSNNSKFMLKAIELSIQSAKTKGGPFGCVIVKDNQIIAEGNNQVTANNDPTAHAEIVAIRNACKKLDNFFLKGCDLYTSCEPCPMCLSAIYWSHIDNIFYANTRLDAADIFLTRLNGQKQFYDGDMSFLQSYGLEIVFYLII